MSIPDFTNVDVKFPEPEWDDALDYVLEQIKAGNPDFVLVAGDLVMGRWWRTKEQVEYMADIYFGAWIQRMNKHNVDLYLCGEVHQMTCIEKDDVEQIVHGGLFGYNTDVNYLVITVTPTEMYCELKEIETVLEGRKLTQSAGNEPYEYVIIPSDTKREGFRTVGTMTVKKEGNKKIYIEKTGYFIEDNNPQ